MFTGIISDIGTITGIKNAGGADTRFEITTAFPMQSVALGASIACSGVCLTVIEKKESSFLVDISAETLRCTTLASKKEGDRLNLERALCLGEELGGHLVSGHVDGLAEVISIAPENGSHRIDLEAPSSLAYYIAAKGSVALDGVSLTVNTVEKERFSVNIIPHTWSHTTLQGWQKGTKVNLEIDLLARYIARMSEKP